MNKLFSKILGANWQTTLSGGLQALVTALVTGTLTFPSDWSNKGQVTLFVLVVIGTFFGLKFATQAKDRNVTGGTVQQTASGAPALKGTQDLVDLTVKATEESGEKVPIELHVPPPN